MYHFLLLAGVLFGIGIFGLLTRSTAAGVLISLQLVYSAACLTLVTFNRYIAGDGLLGQLFTVLLMAAAAAQLILAVKILVQGRGERASDIMQQFRHYLLLLITSGTLIALFKLETDPSHGRGFPTLTLIVAAGMVVLFISARNQSGVRGEPSVRTTKRLLQKSGKS